MSGDAGASATPDLDDAAALARADPGGMLATVGSAGELARAALEACAATDLTGPPPREVVVAGMGGSGIAGDVLQALAFHRAEVPVCPVKGAGLPAFVGPETLLVAVSYSGATEETLAAAEQGLAAGARLVAVASGGPLAELARGNAAPCVTVAGGLQPRAALWSLAVPVLAAAEARGVAGGLLEQVAPAAAALDRAAAELEPGVATTANPAKQAALRLVGRLPIIWGTGVLGAVAAARLRTQCNENAKISAISSAFPEANHNDAQGLEGGLGPRRTLVLMRDPAGEHERDAARLNAVCRVLGVDDPLTRSAGSGDDLERLAELVAFGDFVSTYLGLALGVDPTPIATITRAKALLGPTGG